MTAPAGVLPPGQSTHSALGYSVVNLTNVHLTTAQISALEKGLTFCPTPPSPDISNIWGDLEDFFRRLRIKRYFDGVITEDDPYKGKFRY